MHDNDTTFAYDGLNRLTSETNELNKTRTFEYDAAGNLTKKTDRNGRVTEFVYDSLYRNMSELWKDGGTTVRTLSFAYDVASQLTSASDPDAAYSYTYDALGRATSIGNTLAGLTPTVTLAQAFDANSRRTQLAATIGSTADFKNDYTYDNLNRMTRITQQDVVGGNTVADKRVEIGYNAASQFSSLNRYADLGGTQLVAASSYSYDGTGRLTGLTHAKGSTTFAGYGWSYDAANRATAFTNSQYSAENATYSYDSADQLTGADRSGTSSDETYSYDDNGNRTNTGYTTGTNNRLTSDGTFNYT